jgi:hypothetical protein
MYSQASGFAVALVSMKLNPPSVALAGGLAGVQIRRQRAAPFVGRSRLAEQGRIWCLLPRFPSTFRRYTPRHRIPPASMKPEAITRGGDPRSMVPVWLAGAEVAAGFCTSAAGLA